VRNQERIIATIRKGNRNVVVVTTSHQPDQQPSISIRQHEPNGKRELVPTMKGISNIDPSTARDIATAILQVLAGCGT
jgi:hypothetical protein